MNKTTTTKTTTASLPPLTPAQTDYIDAQVEARLWQIAGNAPHCADWMRVPAFEEAVQAPKTRKEKAQMLATLIVSASAVHFRRVTLQEIHEGAASHSPEAEALWDKLHGYQMLLIRRVVIGLERSGEFRAARKIRTETAI